MLRTLPLLIACAAALPAGEALLDPTAAVFAGAETGADGVAFSFDMGTDRTNWNRNAWSIHDFAEVDHCYTVDEDEALPRRISVIGPQAGSAARVPLAARRLGPTVQRCLDQLGESLEGLPHADETMALFRLAYRPERSFGRAFAEVLGALFADEGLLLFDPRDARVAAAVAPLQRQCLAEAAPIAAALRRRAEELEHAPVHVRAGAPLFFYQPRGPEGPRFRLEPRGGDDGYELLGDGEDATVSREQLEQTWQSLPEQLGAYRGRGAPRRSGSGRWRDAKCPFTAWGQVR